jgi:hypothetical protein
MAPCPVTAGSLADLTRRGFSMRIRAHARRPIANNSIDALISVNSMHLCELQAASGTQATGTG